MPYQMSHFLQRCRTAVAKQTPHRVSVSRAFCILSSEETAHVLWQPTTHFCVHKQGLVSEICLASNLVDLTLFLQGPFNITLPSDQKFVSSFHFADARDVSPLTVQLRNEQCKS